VGKSRAIRVIRLTTLALLGTVALAVVAASFVLQGSRLGRLIEGALPPNRGKMHIGGVTWHLRALVDLVTDAPSPIAVDGLRIVDPDGVVVLDVPHLEARVKLRTLIGGSFSIHDLRAPYALWRFAQMKDGSGIGFLAALAPRNPPPPKPKDAPAGPGSYFEIASAELGDLDAIFDFPGAWGLELKHARARASLIQSTVDPKHPIFGFDAGPVVAEGGGYLRILDDNVLPFDRVTINRVATTQDWPDDIFLDLPSADTGKSRLTGKGFFTGIYGATSTPGIKLHAEFAHAGDALGAVAAGKKIPGLAVTGDDASAVLDLTGPFAALGIKGQFRGLDVRYDSYRALGLGFDLGFDGGAGRVDLTQFGFGAPGGGRFDLDAHLDTNKLALGAKLRFTGFHTDSYVPPGLRAMAGGRLDGAVDAQADLAAKSARIARVDLRLERARAAGLPRSVHVQGAAELSPARVATSGLTVSVAGANATAKGSVDLERKLLGLGLQVVAFDLGRLLGDLGLPPLAQDARLDAQARGPLASPEVTGDALVHGLGAGGRKVPELHARFGLKDGVARLDGLSGPAFGGSIKANGQLRLPRDQGAGKRRRGRRAATDAVAAPELDLDVEARDLDVATLAGSEQVAGRVSLSAHAHGPLDALSANLRIPSGTDLTLLGEGYVAGPVDVALDAGRTVEVRALHVKRRAGGSLDVRGKVQLPKNDLDLDVTLDRLPIEGLPGVADAGVPVTGIVSAKLHVGGRPDRPELSGDVALADVVARGIQLGGGHLALTPVSMGRAAAPGVAVRGELFDRFHVDAQAALTPRGLAAHAELAFQRLALEALVPELTAFGDGRGVASGHVTVDVEPGKPLALDVLLPELWLSIARAVEGANGETTVERVRIEAARPLHVSVAGDHVVLDEAHFSTDGGDLHAEGRLDAGVVSGVMSGHLDLELLQPFLRGSLQRLAGDLDLELAASGTLAKPDLRGKVAVVHAVELRPKDFQSDIVVGSGVFTLDSDGVAVQNLAVTVEGSTMRLSGRAGLGPGFMPTDIRADLGGDVSARLLAYVAPDAVSDAQGTAAIKAQLRGTLAKPEVQGRLDLGTIDFRLRDVGSEVHVQSGIVEISNGGLVLHDVKVLLDDQGRLTIGASGVRAGRVQFTNLMPFKPGWVDLPLHGERLTYRSPQVFEVDDLAFDLDLKGSLDDGFRLGGEVRLVSGRYLQDFKVQSLMISPRVNESSVRPFYEGKPLLEDLALALNVRTVGEGFVVQNNIAPEILVDISLHVGGTLSAPTLAGDVRPMDGRFNLPGMRGDFILTAGVNNMTFVATKSVADGDTPDINIEAQNLVTDANGIDHNVRMRIHGPLREAQIDLSTDDGLDRSQTAMLLLTGRTTTEAQRIGTPNPTVGANITTGADVAGQLTRDAIDNLMQPYIDDTFRRLTGFNLRLTVGPDGFEGRLRKRVGRYLNFQSDYLAGFQSTSHWNTSLDLWVFDGALTRLLPGAATLSFGTGIEQIRLSPQQGVAESLPLNYNLELRLDYVIRR
jgi:autotransporter translocation and assembly factor TamB